MTLVLSFFYFPLEYIKLPSPGIELGPCNPQKVPTGLLPLALCAVRLLNTESCRANPSGPNLLVGMGSASGSPVGTLNQRLLGTPECLLLSQGWLPLPRPSASRSASLLIGASCSCAVKWTFCLFCCAVCRAAVLSKKLPFSCMKFQNCLVPFP